MKKKNVLIIYSVPTPYGDPLLDILSKEKEWNLDVFYMGKDIKSRSWFQKDRSFKHRFLWGFTFYYHEGGDSYPIWINPFVIFNILLGKYDVVVCTGWDSLTTFLVRIITLIKNTPFLLWAGSTNYEKSWRRDIFNWLVKWLVRSSNALITYGTLSREYLLRLGAPKEKIFISFNTVDVNLFHKNAEINKKREILLRKELGIGKKQKIVLFVGQLIKRKGVIILHKAIKRISKNISPTVLWIGDGPYKEVIKKDIGKSKSNKHFFYTARSPEELSIFYSISDLFVLPSYEEVWGLVVNESLASELPVVVSDRVGSSVDLVKDGLNGFIFKNGNIVDLANKLQKLLSNKGMLNKMKKQSWLSVKKFNYEQNKNAFKSAINYALKK